MSGTCEWCGHDLCVCDDRPKAQEKDGIVADLTARLAAAEAREQKLRSGIRNVASMCTNCNGIDDAQAELWKLLDGEEPRSGCSPCEWDAMAERLAEAEVAFREILDRAEDDDVVSCIAIASKAIGLRMFVGNPPNSEDEAAKGGRDE